MLSPATWLPAAGAAAFQVGDLDENLSSWARARTPVFGSERNASRFGRNARVTSELLWASSLLAAESGGRPLEWTLAKVEGGLVQYVGAVVLTRQTTSALKNAVGRKRPNGDNDRSFPSGNASRVASLLTLASRNLDAVTLPGGWTPTFRAGMGALAIASAWSRVEAGAHYPSDVLAGLALGHFISAFVNDAFVERHGDLSLEIVPVDGLVLAVGWRF